MTDLVVSECADKQAALKLAGLYAKSFSNQAHSPDVMLRQVAQWCLGKPMSVLQHLCDPSCGAVTRSDRPCLKSLNKWFEDWVGKQTPRAYPEFKALPKHEQDPPEVRKAAVDRWRKVRPNIEGPFKPPKGAKAIQREHSLEELFATVERE